MPDAAHVQLDGIPEWTGQPVGGVGLSRVSITGRCVVRGTNAIEAICEALNLGPPAGINRAVQDDKAAILKLGPDEWLVLEFAAGGRLLSERLHGAVGTQASSIVDVTQRQIGIAVSGAGATDALSTAVPLDLDIAAFPVGMATRTIFEKAEIVLWRRSEDHFQIEVWRSFAPYVAALLDAARAELASGL